MVKIEDTYAEAFESVYSEILITAKNERWLHHALENVTGHASSTIGCDCEAGVDIFTDDTPDNRIGALVQFHVPMFKKEPARELELAVIHRIGNSILTCPTTRVFNATKGEKMAVGDKLGFFGDGHQKKTEKFGRKMNSIPIMMGDFLIEENLSYSEGVMGGNLWLMGNSEDSALTAGEKIIDLVTHLDGVITPFPGGLCSSGSKVGSKYSFMTASTHHNFCPSLKETIPDSEVPEGVKSIIEIIINGRNLEVVKRATHAGIEAASGVEGLIKISAGNYGGKLGKYRIGLR